MWHKSGPRNCRFKMWHLHHIWGTSETGDYLKHVAWMTDGCRWLFFSGLSVDEWQACWVFHLDQDTIYHYAFIIHLSSIVFKVTCNLRLVHSLPASVTLNGVLRCKLTLFSNPFGHICVSSSSLLWLVAKCLLLLHCGLSLTSAVSLPHSQMTHNGLM